ncbi:MAG: hypothetical protein KF716_04835 [Anaerolineae bacterium]|nr:hypothetical protein [Anaerolineae bacterium]
MSDLPDPVIPASTPPEEVIKWMIFYLGGFTTTVQQMADVLATEAHVEAHPKALVTLQRRARDMMQFNEMLSNYLKDRTG